MAQNPNFTFASLIDADYYLGAHPDAARSGLGAAEHYLLSGWKLGYDPNPYFSTGHYLSANPDVAASGTNPLLHYATSGAQEGRSPSILFDQSFYLAHNPDVVASGANPLLHFLRYGAHEGRDPSAFFSVSGYLTANPDVAASGVNPLGHFLQYGWHEGRDPSPHFNTSWYLQQNADVAAAGVNPLEHYLTFGQHEGRDPSPNFDTSWYLEQNADVAASGVNPLGHYLQYGVHEHRVPVEPSLSASTPGADEGDTVTYTFSSPGMPAGTVYSYVLSGVQADDVTGPLSGTVTLDAHGQARLAVTLVADATTEGTESMQLTIGGVVGTVAVRDTSLTQTQFFLTADTDSIAGSSYDDTFTATVAGGFAETDRIDGGDGMDTLVATDAAGFSLAALPVLTDVEVARITTTAGGITIDTTAWSGLETLELSGDGGNTSATLGADTSVTASFTNVGSANTTIQGGRDVAVTLTGSAGSGVTVGSIAAPTGAVTIHNTSAGDSPMGGITVTGGTSVAITQAVTNAVNTTAYIGLVTVNGTALTTSVSVVAPASVNQSSSVAGVLTSPVSIFDVNNASTTEASTITSVTLENPALAAIFGSAVSELHLRGRMNSVLIGNMSTAVAPATTLGLTLDGVTLGSINEGGIYTTLNIATDGAASTMGNLSMAAVQALNLSGSEALTLTSTAGFSALQTVTVAGGAGLTADFGSQGTVTSIDTSTTTGNSTIVLNAGNASFTGGAGIDKVTLSSNTIAHAISLGDGDDSLNLGSQSAIPGVALSGGTGTDTLTMTAALAATASGNGSFAGMVTGFEKLVLSGATNQTIDLAVLGIPDHVSTQGGNGLTLSKLANGGTLQLTGAGTAYTVSNPAFSAGADDTIHLILKDGSTAGVAYASTGIVASGVEHFDITVQDLQATPSGTFNDAVSLLGNSSHTVTIGGNAGLTLTATSTALTAVDASGITLGGFTWTSGALAAAATIHGSASGTNILDLSAATKAVTYTGGSGDDAVTATNGKSNVIELGGGANSLIGSGGNHSVTAGDGSDTVVLSGGNNTVSLGDGSNAFTATFGSNTYVGGAGVDTVTLGGGMNHVTLGAGHDIIAITAPGANLNTYTSVADIGSGDAISFANMGTESFNTARMVLGHNAVFQDYANAVVAFGGNASSNGAFGWFQFGGDTYLVESRHDASGLDAEFVNGTDMIIELAGLVDLSTATQNGQHLLIA